VGRRGWWWFGWLLLGGCAGEREAGVDQAPQSYCETICKKNSQCGSIATVSACRADCLATEFPYSLEPHRLQSVARCLKGLPCASYASDDGWDICFEESADAAYQSATCFEYCEGLGHYLFECGGAFVVDEVQQECIDDWGCSFSDSVLARASACLDRDSCEGREACFDVVFP
jgi:hypothetical protein